MGPQAVYDTRARLNRDGFIYGEEFVSFDEVDGMRPVSQSLWNPATNLFEVAVVRRNGGDLGVKNLPLQTAERLTAAINVAVSKRNAQPLLVRWVARMDRGASIIRDGLRDRPRTRPGGASRDGGQAIGAGA